MRSNASRPAARLLSALPLVVAVAACARGGPAPTPAARADATPVAQASRDVEAAVLRGRQLAIEMDCGACHGGGQDPSRANWLVGITKEDDAIPIGPFKTRPANLTPHATTGLGRYTERQVFNALRYGLKPSMTPDVEITSATPGVGNHPAKPTYLGPPMPWPSWRHLSDAQMWDLVTYLRHGVRPFENAVAASDVPPDGWAGEYTVEKIGRHPLVPFPTAHEQEPASRREEVLRGRTLVAQHACGACHGEVYGPEQEGWLSGMRSERGVNQIGPFKTYARNLTPDNTTGIGRFTERQLFNALRYGLRPGETPDVEITGTTPGVGNFPANPKYLAPPMPWPAWRHMADEDLRAIAAYLKLAVKPVQNRVLDSEGPPDFWASEYTLEKIGPHPAKPFPAASETRRP